MATNQIQELEKVLATIPKHLVDWKGLREWSKGASKTQRDNAKAEDTIVESVGLVSIPSIGEFEQLYTSPSITHITT